ncbi:integumentary mucin C.1-like [Branchiostoma lanceolatum]|uniref:integumentary mucin C.1-like n=1 Tax=Branchiostoma lanceolatum TaxID=7740 RepID=UPI0034568052
MAAATQFSFIVCLLAAMASMGIAQSSPTATATTAATAAATTTAAPGGSTAAPGSTATPGTGPTPTAGTGGSTAAPGTGPTTTAGSGGSTAARGTNAPAGSTAAVTTQSPIIACLSCNGTGAGNDPCPAATITFATTINCNAQEGCWVYREEDSSGNHTISRGCGRSDMNLNDGACMSQHQSEHCNEANNIKVCRRCCTTASCNHMGLTLTGSVGTPSAYVSTVVIVTSAIMAVFSEDLRF